MKIRKISVCVFFLFLAGCTTVSHHRYNKDCAPDFYIDVSKIPDAVPRAEPLSKYGNPACYTVHGCRYTVLKSAKGYDKTGVASWYGMKFHKQRTSSGEAYNVAGMTAASRELPIPTYVQVTNLETAKKVIVKVNDRGPFRGNRLIDLSYVAAKKLGMFPKGTALVEVKAIDPHYPEAVLNTPTSVSRMPDLLEPSQKPVILHRSYHHSRLGVSHKARSAKKLKKKIRDPTPPLVKAV